MFTSKRRFYSKDLFYFENICPKNGTFYNQLSFFSLKTFNFVIEMRSNLY